MAKCACGNPCVACEFNGKIYTCKHGEKKEPCKICEPRIYSAQLEYKKALFMLRVALYSDE